MPSATSRRVTLLLAGAGIAALALSAGPVIAQVNPWEQLHPGGRAPQALQWAASAYESARNRMLVFAGTDQVKDYYDVWALDLSGGREEWALLRPYGNPPLARRQAVVGYDPVGRRLIAFGGYSTLRGDALGDTWILDLSTPTAGGASSTPAS